MAVEPRNRNTNSTLSSGNNNTTSVDLSTNIIIKVGNVRVGAIKTISVNETREIAMITELGHDGVIDSVPKSHTMISGRITRIRFDKLRLFEAFGRGFVHLKSQRYPFDIEIIDRNENDDSNKIITTVKNVWFSSLNYTLSDSDWIIAEDSDYKAETIFSTKNGGNVATGGKINVPYYTNIVERVVDSGDIRGSMSAGDLINLLTNGESSSTIF